MLQRMGETKLMGWDISVCPPPEIECQIRMGKTVLGVSEYQTLQDFEGNSHDVELDSKPL